MLRFFIPAMCLLLSLTAHPVLAQHSSRASAVISTTFRLRVQGTPASDTTFWVAYGPLAGKFGIIRLHQVAPHVYSATQHLPNGKTTFAYVAGVGTVHTRAGLQPGGPVITIRRFGPVTPSRAGRIQVNWVAPIG